MLLKLIKRNILLILLILFFLVIKVIFNGIRLSDTNTYFNVAYQINHGKIIYKDILYADFPFFSYISFFYYLISGKNIALFYFTSSIEVAIITYLIYKITNRNIKNCIISITSSALFVLSYIVLSASDYQTGVFTASLFAVLSYFFLQKRKFVLSGIFIAASFFTKAYFLPIFLSFSVYMAVKREWKELFRFGLAFSATGLIILLPSLIQAPRQLFSDIFGFSLTRPAEPKMNTILAFVVNDLLFFILLLFNIFNIRKNLLFALISIFSIMFFFGYQSVFYLYLNSFIPFLCLSFYELSYYLDNASNLKRFIIPTIIFCFIFLNLLKYISSYGNFERIENIDKIVEIVKAQNPRYLYGISDITPALIALTNIPALENVNEAHRYYFMRKIYDKELLTDKAIKNKTIVTTHGAYHPERNIKQDILDNIIVDEETIYRYCKNILSVPVQAEENINRINFFKCY